VLLFSVILNVLYFVSGSFRTAQEYFEKSLDKTDVESGAEIAATPVISSKGRHIKKITFDNYDADCEPQSKNSRKSRDKIKAPPVVPLPGNFSDHFKLQTCCAPLNLEREKNAGYFK